MNYPCLIDRMIILILRIFSIGMNLLFYFAKQNAIVWGKHVMILREKLTVLLFYNADKSIL